MPIRTDIYQYWAVYIAQGLAVWIWAPSSDEALDQGTSLLHLLHDMGAIPTTPRVIMVVPVGQPFTPSVGDA